MPVNKAIVLSVNEIQLLRRALNFWVASEDQIPTKDVDVPKRMKRLQAKLEMYVGIVGGIAVDKMEEKII